MITKTGMGDEILTWNKNIATDTGSRQSRTRQMVVDGAFATHRDMRSHTGGALSLGKGVIPGVSTRQELMTRSSTEAELVAVDDCMSLILWTRYFLEAQGYGVDDAIIYQDNKSAILLEQNGRASSTR